MNHHGRSQQRSSRAKKEQRESAVHKRPRAAKTRGFRIPAPQAVRIAGRYLAGVSIREIARIEGRDRGTVSRIVKSAEMQNHVQRMREQYYGLAELAMDGIRRALTDSSDGRLAHEILRNLGVIPSAEDLSAIQRQMHQAGPVTEADLVRAEMLKLVAGAFERAQMYNMPVPSMDDLRPSKQLVSDAETQKC